MRLQGKGFIMNDNNKQNNVNDGFREMSIEEILARAKQYKLQENEMSKDGTNKNGSFENGIPTQNALSEEKAFSFDSPKAFDKNNALPFEPIGCVDILKDSPPKKKGKKLFKSRKDSEEKFTPASSNLSFENAEKHFERAENDHQKMTAEDFDELLEKKNTPDKKLIDIEDEITKTVSEYKYETTETLIPQNLKPGFSDKEFDESPTMVVDIASNKKEKKSKELSHDSENENIDGQLVLDLFNVSDKSSSEEPLSEPDYSTLESELKLSRKKKVSGFVLSGEEEDNDPDEEISVAVNDEIIDDFMGYEDTYAVKSELIRQKRNVMSKMLLTALAVMASGYLLLINHFNLKLPAYFLHSENPMLYIITSVSILSIAVIVNFSSIVSSLSLLISGKPDSDSALSLSVFAAIIQNLVMIAYSDQIKTGQLHIYSTFAVIAIFVNLIGKNAMISRIKKNFSYVSRNETKNVVLCAQDEDIKREIIKGIFVPNASVSYSAKSKFLSGYLENSYKSDSCDYFGKISAPVIALCAVAVTVLSAVFSDTDMPSVAVAVTAFSAVCCFSLPIGAVVAMNCPLYRASKKLARSGTMLTGMSAVDSFCDTNVVVMDAYDLFPKGFVDMRGYKTFGSNRLDEAILDTAAVSISAGGPLSEVFRKIIEDKVSMLPKVDSLVYEKDMGVSGWVDGRRILVGNRILMENHGVDAPSRDYEFKYAADNKKVVYLSIAGELNAMFVVTYSPNPELMHELKKMERNNILLLIRTCDANITSQLISSVYNVPEKIIRIMSTPSGRAFDEIHNEEHEDTEAGIAYAGGITGLLKGLYYSFLLKKLSGALFALQVIGCSINLAIVVFFSCFSGISQLSVFKLIFFQLFWLLAIVVLPYLRRRN